jgi:hypothetical protein
MASAQQTDKSSRRKAWGTWLALALIPIGFVWFLFSTAGPFRSVSGAGLSAEAANRMLWTNRVPETATDVWFRSAYLATKIDCKLEEADFRAWCQRKGWRPTPIVAGQPNIISSERLGSGVLIESGLRFDAKYGKAGRGSYGCYDTKAGRAYVFYNGR